MENDPFISFLKKNKHQNFFLCSAPGNSGDILLQKSLHLYLKDHSFNLTIDSKKADIILMHGGGSIDDVWGTGLTKFIDLLDNYPKKIIAVAPCTIHFTVTDFPEILSVYSQSIYIFAREQKTFTYLQDMILPVNVSINLSHDTAFLLKGTEYLDKISKQCSSENILLALRTDKESKFLSFSLDGPPKNFYEKLMFRYIRYQLKSVIKNTDANIFLRENIHFDDISHKNFETFVTTIQRAKVVYTDRLHVAILSTILGKKVHLYDTKYNKVKDVYEQTLHNYPNITPMFD